MTLFDMTGKVAVITGSTKGIGKAIACRMAEHGADVVVSSRKGEACDAVAAEINRDWAKALAPTMALLGRSEEHTSELQSLMRISYAVFCLKKKIHKRNRTQLKYRNQIAHKLPMTA